eukprot:Em0041g33a
MCADVCVCRLQSSTLRGPLVLLRLDLGLLSRGKVGSPELVCEYIRMNCVDQAISLLSSLNWNSQSSLDCFACMTLIMDHLLVQPLDSYNERQLEETLDSFLAPSRPLEDTVKKTYEARIKNLARRFFQLLLRYRRLDRALRLAEKINAKDLFMDLHFAALECNEKTLAQKAQELASNLLVSSSLIDSLQTVLLLDDEDDGSGVPPSGGVMSSADSHDKIGKKRSVKAVLSSLQLLSLKTTSGKVKITRPLISRPKEKLCLSSFCRLRGTFPPLPTALNFGHQQAVYALSKMWNGKIMHSWILRHALFNGMVATLMVATGTIHTLAAKWADLNTAGGSNPVAEHYYDHPFFQTGTMFLGEGLCYAAFKAWYIWRQCNNQDMSTFGDQKFNPLVWAIPAMCDLCGTSMMYVGLTWTYAASYQMLRGSVVIFTGLLSVALNLGNKLKTHHWVGMVTVIVGLVVVGVGDYVFYNGGSSSGLDKNTVLAGDLLIVLAQIITAVQMTVEEKIMKKYKIQPLQGVGLEGIFGFSTLTILLIPIYFIPWHLPASSDFWQERTSFEDTIDAFHQWGYSAQVLVASLGLVFSIAFFNLAGLTVTLTMNTTTRMVLDTISGIIIWVISLAVGWQKFEPLFPVGYIILLTGVWMNHDVIVLRGKVVQQLADQEYIE